MKVRYENCNHTFEVDENNVDKNLDFMQCPNCSIITKNPMREI